MTDLYSPSSAALAHATAVNDGAALLPTIEGDFADLLTEIRADLVKWSGTAWAFSEGIGLKLWLAAKLIILGLTPSLLVEFQGLLVQVLKSVVDGDLADVETAILDLASVDLKAALTAMGSQFVQALIVIVQQL